MLQAPDASGCAMSKSVLMTTATDIRHDIDTGPDELRERVEALRAKNASLRDENRRLHLALDAHIARANGPAVLAPLEFTAGTSGPRRRRKRDES